MIAESVVATMNRKYGSLTKSEKKIADFVYTNQLEVQYMSITNLAEQCRVADATIFRFCKSLGFGGYNEFKLALAKSAGHSKSLTPQSQEDFPIYGKVNPSDSFDTMCKKLYGAEVSALTQTLELADETAMKKAAGFLHGARRVYCLGQGASLVMAMEAWSRFITVSPNFYYVEDSHLQAISVSLLGENDVILFFSYSGATRDMPDILRPAHERGVKVILVTHFAKSPAAYFADVILLVGSNEGPLQQGSIAAKLAQLFVVDVLFNQFWRMNPDGCKQNHEISSDATAVKLL